MGKKTKIENANNNLHQKVESIIKNKSVSVDDYLKDKKQIEIYFRRPSQNEERKVVFNDFHDKIEVRDIRLLKFN